MRNFEERMAEIARRSDQRIRRAKQLRERVMAACVPLVLCISLGAVMLYGDAAPTQIPADTVSTTQELSAEFSVYHGTTLLSRGQAQPLEDLLTDIRQNQKVGSNYSAHDTTKTASNNAVYTVIIDTPNEVSREYTLCGYALTDKVSEEVLALTSTQRLELIQLLGIH